MNNEQVAELISFELFKSMVDNIEKVISNKDFKKDVEYHSEQINKSLGESFKDIVLLINSVVDKFYISKYDIPSFMEFSINDFNSCLSHNLGLIRNCKKLLKFAEI